jgi:hypothetical protein
MVDSSCGDRLGVALRGEVTSTPPCFGADGAEGVWARAETTLRRTTRTIDGKNRPSERGRVIATSAER